MLVLALHNCACIFRSRQHIRAIMPVGAWHASHHIAPIPPSPLVSRPSRGTYIISLPPSPLMCSGGERCVLPDAVWAPVLRVLRVSALRSEPDVSDVRSVSRRGRHCRRHHRPGTDSVPQDGVPGACKAWKCKPPINVQQYCTI